MKKFLLLSFVFLLIQSISYAQPPNDACAGAFSVTPDGTCYGPGLPETTTAASGDHWIGTLGCQSGNNNEVWFTFVATNTQLDITVTSGTLGGNIEFILVEDLSPPCGTLSLHGSLCGASVLSGSFTGLNIGATYYYTISSSTGTDGTFTTCVNNVPQPILPGQDCPAANVLCNDNPFSVASISSGAGAVFGNGSEEDMSILSCFGGDERQSQWYTFTASTTGTIEFSINPIVASDDYDWVLLDVTTSGCALNSGSAPVIACNWSGCPGSTGLSSSPATEPGASICGGPPGPCGGGNYARAFCNETAGSMVPPTITAGQTYVLLIDNFSITNNGFNFTWGGVTSGMTATIGPLATFTTSTFGCDVTFTNGAITPNFTYTWDFGDGSPLFVGPTPPVHTYAGGSYTATLTVTDPNGCTDIFSMVVSCCAPYTIDAGVDQTICAGSTATMSGTAGGGVVSTTWSTSGDGGFNNASLLGAIYTPGPGDIAAGTVTLTLTSDDPDGVGPCLAVSDFMILTISPLATTSAGPDQTICAGSTATMAGTFGGGASSITWSTSGDGGFNNASLPGAIYTPGAGDIVAGSVILTITTDDPAGPCPAATDFMILTIDVPAFADPGPDQTICEGSTATMAGTFAGSASSITWSTSGDGGFNNTALPGAVYTPGAGDIAAGTVTLTITTDDPAGPCPAFTDFMVLTIDPAATTSAGIDQTVCEGSTATMAGTFGGGASSITWSTSGDGGFNNSALPGAVYTPGAGDIAAGTVTLTITTDDPAGPCPAATDFMVLTIDPAATTSANIDQTICEGSTATMAGSFGGGASSITWSTSGDGGFNNTALTGAVYTPGAGDIAAGTVTLTITTDDPAGPCPAATDFMVLTIDPAATTSAGIDQTVCEGSTATMAGTFGGGASSITWSTSGDGGFNNSALPGAVYTPGAGDIAAGTVTLTITTDDPAGPCPAATDFMVLTIDPAATTSANIDQTICEGSTATMAGSFGGGASSITWSTSGDGGFNNAALTGAVYTPGAGDIAAGTVTLTITTDDPAGPCPAATDFMVLTIDPAATTSAGIDQTVCEGSTATMAGTFGGGASSITWSTSGDGGFNNTALPGAVYTPGAGDIAAGTVTLTITTDDPAGPCPAATDFMVLTIDPAATTSANIDQTICEGSTATMAGSFGGGASSITWSTSGDGGFNNTALTGAVYTPGAGDIAAGTVTLTITTDDPAGPCPAATDFMVLTITPGANTSAGTDATICEGSTHTLSGTFGGSASSITWSTSGDGGFNNNTLPGATYTPGAGDIAAGTVTLTITTDDPVGSCIAVSDFMILTIDPAATTSAGIDQTVCEGSTATMAGIFGGGASSITWSTSGDGGFNNTALPGAVYTPGAGDIAAGTVTLTITTDDPAGPCPAATDFMVLTIDPAATTSANIDQTICEGSTATMAGSFGGGASSITWSTSGDGGFNNTALTGAVYTPGAGDIAAGTVTLTITTDDPAGPCPAATDFMVLTIDPAATTSAGIDQTVCEGSTATMAGTFGGGASSITWSTSGDGGFNNTALPGAVYTPGAGDIAAGTVTLTITTDDPAGSCTAATDFMVLTIDPAATTSANIDQTICEGSTATMAGSFGGGASSITWSTSGDGGFNNTALTGAVYTPGAGDIAAGTVTLTITTDDPAGPCPAATDFMVLTIDPAATTSAGIDQTVCEGSTATMAGTFGGGASSITWSTSGDGGFNNNTLPGAIYTPGAGDIAAGNVTLTITTDDPAGICSAATDFMILTIDPPATTSAGIDQTICEGTTATMAGTFGGSAASITWSTSGDGGFNNNALPGAIYTPGAGDIAAGTVTLTITTDDPAGPCAAATDFMILTITPLPAAPTAGTDATYCDGDPMIDLTAAGSGGTINWYDDAGLTNLVGTGSTHPPANTLGTTTYYVTETVLGCTGPAAMVTVTINALPTIDSENATDVTACGVLDGTITITASGGTGPIQFSIDGGSTFQATGSFTGLAANSYQVVITDGNCTVTGSILVITGPGIPPAPVAGTNATYCFGDPMADLTATAGSGGTLTWYDDAGLTNVVGFGGTHTPSGALGSTTYYVTETVVGCESASTQVTIIVNPVPTAPTAGTDATYCDGDALAVMTATAGSGGTLNWYDDAGLTNLVATGVTHTPANTIGTTIYYITETLTGCTGPAATVTITINPTPLAPTAGADATYCDGDVLVDLTASGGAGTLNWYDDAGLTNLVGTGGTHPPANTLGTTIYYVNETLTGCTGPVSTVTITINPTPLAPTAGTDATYCDGDAIANITASGGAGTLNWYDDAGLTNLVGSGGTLAPANTLGTTIYYVNETLAGCTGPASTVTITINPVPAAPVAGTDAIYCEGDPMIDLTATAGSGGTLNWYDDAGLTNLVGTGTTHTPASTLGTTIYYITETLTGCTSPASMVTITINALPTIDSEAYTDVTACGVVDGTITITASGGTGPIQFSIDGGTNWQASGSFTGLPSNNYQIAITDGNCTVLGSIITITAPGTPPAPVAGTDATYCSGDPMIDMTATAGSGGTLSWYDDALLSNLIGTGTTQAPAATIGTTTYYVTETVAGCESVPSQVVITINQTPTAPVAGTDATYCDGDVLIDLTATAGFGGTLNWYDDAGLTNLVGTGATHAPANTLGTTIYYVTETATGCTGPAATVTITINAIPAAPVAGTDATYCAGNPMVDLTATAAAGGTLNWYDDAGLTNNIGTGGTLTPSGAVGVTTYYVTETVAGCESPASTVTITINPNIAAPVAGADAAYCDGDAISDLTATAGSGGTLNWYDDAALTNNIGTGGTLTPASTIGTSTYYVTETAAGCESPATIITITINPIPAAPVAGTDATYCSSDAMADMTATPSLGGTINWYDDAALTSNIGTGTTLAPNNTIGTSIYYVTETANGCEGPASTVTINIDEAPTMPDAGPDETQCDSVTAFQFSGNAPTVGTGIWTLISGSGTVTTPSDPTSTVTGLSSGINTFEWSISNGVCTALTDEVEITLEDCNNYDINIPTAFTPDGDGTNDVWVIENIENYPDNIVQIYNRWGELIFNSNGYLQPWDGTFEGKEMPVGSYSYVIQLNDGSDAFVGPITIIR